MAFYSDPGGAGSYGALDTTTPSTTWLYGTSGSPSVLSVRQGELGDCWFESAMVCLAAFDPNYIKSMITFNGNGIYTVTLQQGGAANYVTVDDDLPTSANSANNNGKWASLIEKAYAATVGSYTNMINNSAYTAFAALTGQSCSGFGISSANTGSIGSRIAAAVSAGKGIELYSDDLFVPKSEPSPNPLVGNFPTIDGSEGYVLQFIGDSHAYAVVGYDSATGNLILRNPWGYQGSSAYSSGGITYPNAFVSMETESSTDLTSPPGSSGYVMPGYGVDFFSEFEISASDLQYFTGGAITNSALPPAITFTSVPSIHGNDISRSGDVTGPYNFIDASNLEAGYGDLISAFGPNAQAMQNWVNTYEPQEKRADTFDGLDYIASYNDLTQVYKSAGSEQTLLDAGAEHYISYGIREGRTTTFNGLDYIASYGDLIKAFGVNGDAGACHYIEHGTGEGRSTSFDGLDYIASYGDLINAFGVNEQAGAAHFIQYGCNEGRKTTFDGLDYIAGYTDLMKAFGANNDAGAAHFITHGLLEGRNAQPFNVTSYEQSHSDLSGRYSSADSFLTAYISTYATTGQFLA